MTRLITRLWITGATAAALAAMGPGAMPVCADATLVINGTATPADVRPLGGTAYVRLSDVAKALGLTVVRHGTSYELVNAGGANQVEGLNGKIGDTLFDGQWRFQVQSVETPASYTGKFLDDSGKSLSFDRTTHVAHARSGYKIVAVHCRMTNGQKSMQTFWFAQASEMHINNSLTDTNGESYPPDLFDVDGGSIDQSKSLLPGAKTDFVVLFSVPETLQRKDLKDLVFTLKNNGSGPAHDVRVSLAL